MVFKTLIWEGRPLVRVLLLASCKYSHKVSFAALDAQVTEVLEGDGSGEKGKTLLRAKTWILSLWTRPTPKGPRDGRSKRVCLKSEFWHSCFLGDTTVPKSVWGALPLGTSKRE